MAIQVVPVSEVQSGWYSRYFLFPKSDGMLCPILDLVVLSKHPKIYKFQMLTLEWLLQSVRPSDWLTSIDLEDECFHVAIHPLHRKFLKFHFKVVAQPLFYGGGGGFGTGCNARGSDFWPIWMIGWS